MDKILTSTQEVIKNAEHVSLDKTRINEIDDTVSLGNFKHWLFASPIPLPRISDNEMLHFLLILNALSFCYWDKPKWQIEYKNQTLDGAWAMIGALVRGLEEDRRLLDFKYLQHMTLNDFGHLLRGNVEIPLIKERYEILNYITTKLARSYDGQFANVIKLTKNTSSRLETIVNLFPSFQDKALYRGKKVYFYKRAQLLLSDVYYVINSFSTGVDQITACADYKLPAVLRQMGVLKYSPKLAAKIDNQVILPAGSAEEIETRSATIWAVEYLKQAIQTRHPQQTITAHQVNDYLWLLSQDKNNYQAPYHLTKTTNY